jgi:glycosyltransferase involved in cell wall biosynthesis
MDCAVVIPTYKGAECIPYLIRSLASQSIKEFRVIFVVKPSDDLTENVIGKLSNKYHLRTEILIQKDGYVTRALKQGVNDADEDVILVTDDDAILPADWIKKHLEFHVKFPRAGAVSGNVTNYDLISTKVFPLETSKPLVHLYRRLVRPLMDRPHKLFLDYRFGVYITKDYRIVAGHYIPEKLCLSLPCRGVNLSFKKEAIEHVRFPEHPLLKRYLNWEPYIGVQLVMEGWDAFYVPDVYVYHIMRQSLSRTKNRQELVLENSQMRRLLKDLLKSYLKTVSV